MPGLNAVLASLERWFPGASNSTSMHKQAESDIDTPLSFLPHTLAYDSWRRERGLLLYEPTSSRRGFENVAAGVVQFATKNERTFRSYEVLYFPCPDCWKSQPDKKGIARRRLTEVFAQLLFQLLYAIEKRRHGPDSLLRDKLSNLAVFGQNRKRSVASPDVLNALGNGAWQTCARIFTEVFRISDTPFIVAIDNIDLLEDQAESLVLTIHNWCSMRRKNVVAVISGSSIPLGELTNVYSVREDTEYLGKLKLLFHHLTEWN
jgi:hypothetical protein